jgi:leucyl aminopeptidase
MAVPEVRVVDDLAGGDLLAVGLRVADDFPQVSAAASRALEALDVDVAAAAEALGAKGAVGEAVALPVTADGGVRRLALLGLGADDLDVAAARKVAAALAGAARGAEVVVTDAADGLAPDALRAFVEAYALASYTFRADGAAPPEPARRPAAQLDLTIAGVTDEQREAVRRGLVVARAVHLARDLANTPSNVKSPTWLADRARSFADGASLAVDVRERDRLAAEGFGGILGVGSGSAAPPVLIELRYRPPGAPADAPHVVLVGKGITFDTGGISLKPADAMAGMKTDMAAGGAVLAVMAALPDLDVRVPVTGLVAAAENMPGASAIRPGDVLTHFGGRTVEVLNTDAEGRLVLADAMAYADARLAPDVLVDLATLTGAASLGLGRQHAALYTADDDLAAELSEAGTHSGDRVWRMPLVEDYRPALDSEVADLANISRDPSIQGGSITAALFLREFAGDRRWAHLDIAGPARSDQDVGEISKGGTGFGTRLLLRWLEALSGA